MSLVGSYRSLRAGAALFATVVGVGVFALPYVFARAGFFIGFGELVVLAFFELILLLMYAEITVQTPGRQRFGGYMGHYLGKPGRVIATVITLVSMLGSLIAFTILGGQFLAQVSGWPVEVSASAIAFLVALMTAGGLKEVSRLSGYITVIIAGLYGVLILFCLPFIHLQNLLSVAESPSDLLLPYGVIIFALAGLGAIPEMHDILERQYHKLPKVVMFSYGGIVLLYALFAFAVVGVTGAATSPDALTGLIPVLAPAVLLVGTILGLVSVVSIHSMVSLEYAQMLRLDVKIPPTTAWLVTALLPLIIFFLGVREFIGVMGFVGSVLAGVFGVLLVVAYESMKRKESSKQKKCLRIPTWLSFITAVVFLFGVLIGI